MSSSWIHPRQPNESDEAPLDFQSVLESDGYRSTGNGGTPDFDEPAGRRLLLMAQKSVRSHKSSISMS